jgi:hypothetical protein
MTRIPYDIHLTGLRADDGAISMAAMAEVCAAVVDNAARALRLHVEGVSTKGGRQPEWLREASNLVIRDIRPGSTVLTLDAPAIGSGQAWLSEEMSAGAPVLDPDATAISLLSGTIREVEQSGNTSDRLDRGMLDGLTRFSGLTRRGIRIDISSLKRPVDRFCVDQSVTAHVVTLKQQTPPDHAVIVAGRLERIGHSDRAFELITEEGRRIRGSYRPGGEDEDRLRRLWGELVTAQGMARYAPSGRVRSLDATSMRVYEPVDEYLIEVAASNRRVFMPDDELPANSGDALREIWGQWPGDETIEELLEALRSNKGPSE